MIERTRARDEPGERPEAERTLTFTVPALPSARRTGGKIDRAKAPAPKLVGYYTQGKVPNWTRLGEYRAWKDHVRLHAPPELRSLRPRDEGSRVRLDVACFFAHGTHPDPENVRKGIVDALFPGGDKWVYGQHDRPRYDPSAPRAEVTVTVFASHLPAQQPSHRGTGQLKATPEAVTPEVPAIAAPKKTSPKPRGDRPKGKRSKHGATKKHSATKQKQLVKADGPPAKRTFWGIVKNAFAEAAQPSGRAEKSSPSEAARRRNAAPKGKKRG